VRGPGGYRPDNALTTLQRLGAGHEILVMVTGYNDPGSSFATSVDLIMNEARARGIRQVIWLTMRTADVTYVSPTFQSNTYTFRDNNRILLLKAQQYGGALQVADWATYSAAARSGSPPTACTRGPPPARSSRCASSPTRRTR